MLLLSLGVVRTPERWPTVHAIKSTTLTVVHLFLTVARPLLVILVHRCRGVVRGLKLAAIVVTWLVHALDTSGALARFCPHHMKTVPSSIRSLHVFELRQVHSLIILNIAAGLHTRGRCQTHIFKEHVRLGLQVLALLLGVGNVAKHVGTIDRLEIARCRLIIN